MVDNDIPILTTQLKKGVMQVYWIFFHSSSNQHKQCSRCRKSSLFLGLSKSSWDPWMPFRLDEVRERLERASCLTALTHDKRRCEQAQGYHSYMTSAKCWDILTPPSSLSHSRNLPLLWVLPLNTDIVYDCPLMQFRALKGRRGHSTPPLILLVQP